MEGRFSMSLGVASLLGSAIQGQSDAVGFLLLGDLYQMSVQERALIGAGLRVGRRSASPGLYTEVDFKLALGLIWKNRIVGWWNYSTAFAHYGICKPLEFHTALEAECGEGR